MNEIPSDTGDTRSGFAAIVGKPNAGKSTLLNALVGEKVAIVSPKPNTTRNRIAGIVTHKNAQAIFIDTPGIHDARDGLNKRMVKTAFAAIADVDIILVIVEAGSKTADMEIFIANKAAETRAKRFLVINKIDQVQKPEILPEIEKRLELMGAFDEVIPISALKDYSVDVLKKLVMDSLPPGPYYYPDDIYTDQPERSIVAEMVREQVFLAMRKEVPYATAVSVEEWNERERNVFIRARIHVERNSQKGIIIGKRGETLKKIGSNARVSIEKMLGTKVYLELFVEVVSKWRRDDKMLDRFGYSDTN